MALQNRRHLGGHLNAGQETDWEQNALGNRAEVRRPKGKALGMFRGRAGGQWA